MPTVLTVLRSGGEFNASHVQALQRQVRRWSTADFVCLSDVPIPGVETVPLEHKWPGWWAKLELFRPDLKGDFLFTDLDNVILGPIDDILAVEEPMFNRGGPNGAIQSGLMRLPEYARPVVWERFLQDPEGNMQRDYTDRGGSFGDAGFISLHIGGRIWEDVLPSQVVNLATLKRRTYLGAWWFRVPEKDVRVLLCHRPHRPWTLPMFKRLYGEAV